MPAVRFTLDNIVNSAVLVVCLVLGANATIQLIDRLKPRPDPTAGATYQTGDVLPALSNYSYSDADATLVLAVRSTCGFCTQSMPFYARLVDDIKRTNGNVNIVAVSTEPSEVLQKYFESHSVALESLRSVPSDQLQIVGTPTILLVDTSGVVQNAWIGLLDQEREAAVLSAVTSVRKRSES